MEPLTFPGSQPTCGSGSPHIARSRSILCTAPGVCSERTCAWWFSTGSLWKSRISCGKLSCQKVFHSLWKTMCKTYSSAFFLIAGSQKDPKLRTYVPQQTRFCRFFRSRKSCGKVACRRTKARWKSRFSAKQGCGKLKAPSELRGGALSQRMGSGRLAEMRGTGEPGYKRFSE